MKRQINWLDLKKLFVAGIAPALVLAGCNSTPSTQNTTGPLTEPVIEQAETIEASDEAQTTTELGEARIIEVEGGGFYYKPNEIRVKKGEQVKIVLKSVDMMHDFVIDELDVRSEIIKSGDTREVEFTADTVGEFEFYCSVGQHRANGMVGTLIVEE